jgi:hypothetical protein
MAAPTPPIVAARSAVATVESMHLTVNAMNAGITAARMPPVADAQIAGSTGNGMIKPVTEVRCVTFGYN